MFENWEKIKKFPRYSVSDNGLVRNDKTGYVMSGRPNCEGRHRVCLQPGSVGCIVSRLVLEAFVGPAPEGKPNALHNINDLSNNRVDNLRWGDQFENMSDSVRDGTQRSPLGEKQHKSKMTNIKVQMLRYIRKQSGLSYNRLGEIYGIYASTSQRIDRRLNWKHIA